MTQIDAAGSDVGKRGELRRPFVVGLDEQGADEASLTGGKGAALATAARAGLPVIPGFVVTTVAISAVDAEATLDVIAASLEPRWRALSEAGSVPLVVRSSSTVEDLAASSMAGRFRSVVGVAGWPQFLAAVEDVLRSREEAAAGGEVSADEPIAVVVQRMLDTAAGGVVFGVDPVTGREDRMVVAAVEGQPDRLVSGEVAGARYELDRGGKVIRHEHGDDGAKLPRRLRRQLVELAERAAVVFGAPQDVEWGVTGSGRLWLLQSRPVTTPCRGVPTGPLLGPGPVSETFPDPLTPLEQALWVEPLRAALRQVFLLTGTASKREVDASPLAVAINGRVAVDLELFEGAGTGGARRALDPRPKVRRLRAAWRVGRLRAALPGLAERLLQELDRQLGQVPDPAALSDRQLMGLLERSRRALTAAHGHEVLLGLVVAPEASGLTGTGLALRTLASARGDGVPDAEIMRRHPIVLALTAAHVGPPAPLPEVTVAPEAPATPAERPAVLREALRLRVRWLQEVTATAAWELGRRWAEAGVLDRPEDVAGLSWDDVCALAEGRGAKPTGGAVEAQGAVESLPVKFRLGTRGSPIPVVEEGDDGGGAGAGGGVATGVVHQGEGSPPEGSVLVVGNLDPSVAPLLPRIVGLVAETGSVLAHAAILAREAGVATVVGYPGALDRLPSGTKVRVDGTAGTVEIVEEEDAS